MSDVIKRMYRTAYSPLYQCYVSIVRCHQDVDGNWIFCCGNREQAIDDVLFRETELTNFCL